MGFLQAGNVKCQSAAAAGARRQLVLGLGTQQGTHLATADAPVSTDRSNPALLADTQHPALPWQIKALLPSRPSSNVLVDLSWYCCGTDPDRPQLWVEAENSALVTSVGWKRLLLTQGTGGALQLLCLGSAQGQKQDSKCCVTERLPR